jgi:hypothetical protein
MNNVKALVRKEIKDTNNKLQKDYNNRYQYKEAIQNLKLKICLFVVFFYFHTQF